MVAAAAGLILGLWLTQPSLTEPELATRSSLIEAGALLVDGALPTLDQLYLSAGVAEEETTP
jgi:hypothetical protein